MYQKLSYRDCYRPIHVMIIKYTESGILFQGLLFLLDQMYNIHVYHRSVARVIMYIFEMAEVLDTISPVNFQLTA